MTGIYGNFSTDEEDFFSKRVKALTKISELTVNDITKKYPNLSGYIKISYPNISIVIGRYLNDRKRLKTLHNTDPIHKSKIVSHVIKWIRINNIIFVDLNKKDINSFTEYEKKILFNVNNFLVTTIVSYFFTKTDNSCVKTSDYEKVIAELIYHIKTDSYDEHLASIILSLLSGDIN